MNWFTSKFGRAQVLLAGLMLPWVAPGQNATVSNAPVSFRIMTYNIHHGEGLDGKVDLERIAALIRRERADIVALQEVDRGVKRTGGRDFPAELAKLTGMSCVFSNNYSFQGGEYGNLVLSRFPVQRWTNSLLPRISAKEQRGVLQVCLEVQGRELVFLDTHLDSQSESERSAQAAAMVTLSQTYAPRTVVLCGDLNTVPGSKTYKTVAERFVDLWPGAGSGDGFTIPAEKPNRRIDYIWVSQGAALKAVKAWVPRSEASDHVPVVGEVRWE